MKKLLSSLLFMMLCVTASAQYAYEDSCYVPHQTPSQELNHKVFDSYDYASSQIIYPSEGEEEMVPGRISFLMENGFKFICAHNGSMHEFMAGVRKEEPFSEDSMKGDSYLCYTTLEGDDYALYVHMVKNMRDGQEVPVSAIVRFYSTTTAELLLTKVYYDLTRCTEL